MARAMQGSAGVGPDALPGANAANVTRFCDTPDGARRSAELDRWNSSKPKPFSARGAKG